MISSPKQHVIRQFYSFVGTAVIDDGEYVAVKAIYEGRRERLRPKRTSQLRRILRERLLDEGVTEFPVLYLIMKSEWDRHPDPA